MAVRNERTGWRDDLRLNDRHRQWGWDCPAVDIDKLFIEYDHGHPVAIVEYKNEHAQIAHSTDTSIRAIIELGNRAQLPVFGVRYADNFSWFRVVPLNDDAKQFLPIAQKLTERDYVALLYKIRGRTLPSNLFKEPT
jgi:hypothetical protein